MIAEPLQIRALSDGRAGNARQAEALAAAIASAPLQDGLLLEPTAPWRWLAPRRLPGAGAAFGAAFSGLLTSPPAIAIGCGRQAALATRLLRARGSRSVQILDPRLPARHWDLVVVPEHDRLRGANVITLLGSLHPVDDDWLAAARQRFPAPGRLPGPRTAVLLGGSSRHARFSAGDVRGWMRTIEAEVRREGGSLLVTASRRTPDDVHAILRTLAPALRWQGPDDGENPYPGLLAWADRIVCSPDSVNMVSEACATRVPVFVPAIASVEGAPRRFLDALLARGRIRPLEQGLEAFDALPLRETARVAAEVKRRLGLGQ